MGNQSRHARGRHAKAPSEIAVKCDRLIAAALQERNRRKLVAASSGVAAVVLLVVAAIVGLSATGPGNTPKAVAAAKRSAGAAATPSATTDSAATGADPDEGAGALAYYKSKDPDDKIAKHVKEVVRGGQFLRVYTDLEEGDENSEPAIKLCEWTVEYLKDETGDADPIVFVHAKENDNGNVVLANKQSAKDDCKVGETK